MGQGRSRRSPVLLAEHLARRLPGRVATSSPQQLARFMDVLEVIASVPQGAEAYLSQCFFAATVLLCVVPSCATEIVDAKAIQKTPESGPKPHRAPVSILPPSLSTFWRRVGAFCADLIHRYGTFVPTLRKDALTMFEQVLNRKPLPAAAAGA